MRESKRRGVYDMREKNTVTHRSSVAQKPAAGREMCVHACVRIDIIL